MAEAGFDAVLVGEALVRAPDPSALVADLATPTVGSRS
jgi:indole-3-glycerol phosphate synthase